MVGITYQNKFNKQYMDDYLFENYQEASKYLKNKGFIEISRVFHFESDWGGKSFAYITPFKIK